MRIFSLVILMLLLPLETTFAQQRVSATGQNVVSGESRLGRSSPVKLVLGETSKRLGSKRDYPFCALSRSDETCACSVELEGNTWWLRKYDENFTECICEAHCLSLK